MQEKKYVYGRLRSSGTNTKLALSSIDARPCRGTRFCELCDERRRPCAFERELFADDDASNVATRGAGIFCRGAVMSGSLLEIVSELRLAGGAHEWKMYA